MTYSLKIKIIIVLTVVYWTVCWSANQKVAGSIPSQCICLSCGPSSQLWTFKKQMINVSLAHWCPSPSLSFSFPLSLRNKVLKLHSAVWRQPWGWCGLWWKWVWHHCANGWDWSGIIFIFLLFGRGKGLCSRWGVSFITVWC